MPEGRATLSERCRAKARTLARPLSLAVSLVVLSLSVLLFVDLMGMRDGGRSSVRDSRKLAAQTLAMHLSTLIQTGDDAGAEYAASVIVTQNDDVHAVALIRTDGVMLGQYGDIERLDGDDTSSTVDRMNVPIYADSLPWGLVRVVFAPDAGLRRDLLWFGLVASGLFLSFALFLRRVLVQLDPGRAVPGRVDSALSLFSAGVVVLDQHSRIIVANPAAAKIADKNVDKLIGQTLDSWSWQVENGWQAPWATVLHGGPAASDEMLELRAADGSTRWLSVSCAFVGDEAEGLEGVLVTLDDLTTVELKNRALAETLQELNETQASISKKNRELEVLASTDPLTGLSNRRSLMELLAVDLSRCVDSGAPLACIMLDIDHFKSVNDTYGHAVGDDVIKAVAGVMKSAADAGVRVGRLGGEEFVMVLPDRDAMDAVSIAESMRVGVVALALGKRLDVSRLSASFGVSDLTSGAVEGAQLLDLADQALYRAKQGGRNRVELYAAEGTCALPVEQLVGTADTALGQPSNEVILQGRVYELEARLTQRERELDTLREYDPLTGVPRRTLFLQRIDTELERAQRKHMLVGVMSFAIRGLERIVAMLGHARGEAFVVSVVDRLQEGLRSTDLVAPIVGSHSVSRMTPNEYGVLLTELTEASGAMIVIARLKRLLSQPFIVDGERIYVGAHIGIALSERVGTSGSVLLEQACEARSEAAASPEKVSHVFASAALDDESHDYIRLEADLHDALDSGSLEAWFQPKFDLETRLITGMEALLRWQHPTRGFVSPQEFVLLAEANGMMEQLFEFVLERTLGQIAVWNAMGIDDLCVSINVSPAQLRSSTLVQEILQALDRTGVKAQQLEIELTETSVIEKPEEAMHVLEAIRACGIKISLDDFGTGFSSMSLLSRLPLDTLKIDRSFIVAMADSERDEAMVESIILMARALKLRVIAEGVETNEELEKLAYYGCNEVQGYLISRPLAPDAITEYLVRQRSVQSRRAA